MLRELRARDRPDRTDYKKNCVVGDFNAAIRETETGIVVPPFFLQACHSFLILIKQKTNKQKVLKGPTCLLYLPC